MRREFKLPDVGEGLTEAEIVRWHVKAGDQVKVNQIVVEIETAKSIVELPIPWEGVIADLMAEEGQTVDVGLPIVAVDTGEPTAEDLVPNPPAEGAVEPGAHGSPAPKEERQAVLVGYGVKTGATKRRPRKPTTPGATATNRATETNRPPGSETPAPTGLPGAGTGRVDTGGPGLEVGGSGTGSAGRGAAVSGATRTDADRSGGGAGQDAGSSGAGSAGRGAAVSGATRTDADPSRVAVLAKPPVRKLAKDLGVDLATLSGTGPQGSITRDDVHAAVGTGVAEVVRQTPAEAVREEERIPVKGVRKMTAQAMVASAFTAPHVTEFLQIDVTETMRAVQRLKALPDFAEVKVSPLLLVAKAVLVAIARHPMINSSWTEDEIVVKRYVNLGIAAATPRGLVVPNIKGAHSKNLPDLARAFGELTETARAGRTQPKEMSGGTFTITNVGVFGVDTGTPIINPGESAILAFGQVRDMPWVVDGELAVRKVTTLSLSFDHRVIDGELGSLFLRDVGAMLEDPLRMLAWS